MTMRFRKKVVKKRGSKSHGYGGKKKHRGGGSRGGRGNAGMFKHKKSMRIKQGYKTGRRGFKVPQKAKSKVRTINLIGIDKIASATGKKELNLAELGYQKLLGSGRITRALIIRGATVSAKAKAKIEEAGGKVAESE